MVFISNDYFFAALKKSYVDVFNPSGAPMKPIENVMAPSLPNMPQAGGFLIPGAAPVDLNQNQHQNVRLTSKFKHHLVYFNPIFRRHQPRSFTTRTNMRSKPKDGREGGRKTNNLCFCYQYVQWLFIITFSLVTTL